MNEPMNEPGLEVSPDDRPLFRDQRATPRSTMRWVLLLCAVLVLLAGVYYVWMSRQAPPPAPVVSSAPPPVATAPAEPRVEHPVAGAPAEALPALGESDAALGAALAQLFGTGVYEQLFVPEALVRHIVVTIDNLPRHQVAARMLPFKPVPGALHTSGGPTSPTLAADNAARYTPYVRAFEAVDSKKLAAVYTHYYPLFQQSYVEQGYPTRYFNDRLFEVIDHLLATPDTKGPIALVQPKVLYEYADPQLEELSAGQKAMLRMGPDNEARVKAKLRELRKALQTP
jgi:Protein of unknown function (DUF3014)